MLTEKQKKLVKKYCLRPTLAVTAFLTAIGIGGVFLLLEMILGVFFNGGGAIERGLWVYIAIVLVYMMLFCYWMLSTKLGMRRKTWQEIVEKSMACQTSRDYSASLAGAVGLRAAGNVADHFGKKDLGDALDAAGAIAGAATVTAIGMEQRANARRVAEACRMEIPSAKGKVLAMIFLPVILLVICYIPLFKEAVTVQAQEQQLAAQTVYALRDVFEKEFATVMTDDPMEEYDDILGYDVTGYVREIGEKSNARISVQIGNDGLIQRVDYTVDLDIYRSKEENLQWADSQLQLLNEILNQAQVPAAGPEMYEYYPLPEDFRKAFTLGSYYEGIYSFGDTRGTTEIDFIYSTDDEEGYDEYSRSRISVFVEAELDADYKVKNK